MPKIIMKHHILLTYILIILTSTIASASESQYEKHMAKGTLAVETGNYREAESEFSNALKEKPNDHTATLYLGIAQSRSGDKEAASTLKKALSINPDDPRTNLELGIYYFKRETYEEAEDYFENAVRLAPDREFSEKAGEYLKMARSGGKEKAWALNISGGAQYDSNVVLNPEGSPLPQGISRKSDWRGVIYLKGKYNIIRSKKAEGTISYSLYNSTHSRLSEFDIRQHQLEASAGYSITDMFRIKGAYTFEYIYVGGDDYSRSHTIGPSLVITEGKGFSTEIEYRYRDSRYINAELFLDNSERTGSNNLIGIIQNIPISKAISARFGYAHDRDNTRKDFWDYRGDKGRADIRASLPWNIYMDLGGEYYGKHYDGSSPASATGQKRRDKVYTGSIAATKVFTEKTSATLGQLYTRNRSNIDAFDYKRAITSIFINVRF